MAKASSRGPAGAERADDEVPFEQGLAALESIVDRLESDELELEEALAAFEQGVRISGRCAAQLDEAEQRVEILVRENGGWSEQPFDVEDDAEEDPG